MTKARLRRQRQLPLSIAGAAGSKARLVQVAPPSESKNASELGEVFGTTQAFPTSASQYPCPNLGRLATSHTDGGAVWWKSPSTDLARARGGQPPLATLHKHQVYALWRKRAVKHGLRDTVYFDAFSFQKVYPKE